MYSYIDRDGKDGITIDEFAAVMFKSQFWIIKFIIISINFR